MDSSASKRQRNDGGGGAAARVQALGEQTQSGATLDLQPAEEIRQQLPNVALYLKDYKAGVGTLFVTTARVVWRSTENAVHGYCLEYRDISLHAVCRDSDAYPEPCLFCQLTVDDADDVDVEDAATQGAVAAGSTNSAPSAGSKRSASSSAAPDLGRVDELRFVPEDTAALDGLFAVMSACAELHPDSDNDGEEDSMMNMMGGAGGGEGWFTSMEDVAAAAGAGEGSTSEFAASLAALEARMVMPEEEGVGGDGTADDAASGRFDDAEELGGSST